MVFNVLMMFRHKCHVVMWSMACCNAVAQTSFVLMLWHWCHVVAQMSCCADVETLAPCQMGSRLQLLAWKSEADLTNELLNIPTISWEAQWVLLCLPDLTEHICRLLPAMLRDPASSASVLLPHYITSWDVTQVSRSGCCYNISVLHVVRWSLLEHKIH